jgi:hypothetical protein
MRCGFWAAAFFNHPANSVGSSGCGFWAARNPTWVDSSAEEQRSLKPPDECSNHSRPTTATTWVVSSVGSEQGTFNPKVAGSSPAQPTDTLPTSSTVESTGPWSRGSGFDSQVGCYGPVAKLVKATVLGTVIAGSNPAGSALRVWRNWYSRPAQTRMVTRPWEFDSPHAHYALVAELGIRARFRAVWPKGRGSSILPQRTVGKGGGNGRRAGPRNQCRKACGFKSRSLHDSRYAGVA